MNRANGPRSLHSPFSAPGLESLSGLVLSLAAAVIDAKAEVTDTVARYTEVEGKGRVVLHNASKACVTSSGNDIR